MSTPAGQATPQRASAILQDAAFGASPGQWPLPMATTPMERWLRAVGAGGQGYYASAHSELSALRTTQPQGRLASLALSTRGSLLRQLGWHRQARGWDGRALALADGDVEARSDALVGLAADALGMARFAASAALLSRAEAELVAAEVSVPRLPVRLQWVSAELAMATGDGTAAVRHAKRGVELAGTGAVSARHRVKSNVVLAAALCSSGALGPARQIADSALETTGELGLIPLRWALAALLDGIGSASCTVQQVQEIKENAADTVRRRGGNWCDG